MKNFIIACMLLLPLITVAQKVEVKDSIIKVDGADYARIAKDGCGMFQDCKITVYDLSGKAAIMVKYKHTKSTKAVSSGNPNGDVHYADIYFLQAKQQAQIVSFTSKPEKVAKQFVKASLFKDGKLDDEAVGNFVLTNPIEYGKGETIIVIPHD